MGLGIPTRLMKGHKDMDETSEIKEDGKCAIPRPKVLDELAQLAAVTVMRSEAYHRYRIAVTLDEYIEIRDYRMKTDGSFDNTVMGHKLLVDDEVRYANPGISAQVTQPAWYPQTSGTGSIATSQVQKSAQQQVKMQLEAAKIKVQAIKSSSHAGKKW